VRRLALAVVVLALAGCGGGGGEPKVVQPHLPRALAADWRAQTDGVAAALDAGDGCEARRRAVALQTSVITAVNARRVPPRFQETLLGTVNELATRIGCTPPAPAPTPAPASDGAGGNNEGGGPPPGHGPGQGHGHGHGHGKGKK